MNIDDWVISFTFDADPDPITMIDWEEQLEGFDTSVSRMPGYGIEVTVYASGRLTMLEAVGKMIGEVAHVLQLPAPIGMEVLTETEYARRAEAPTMPELMSAAEIADELGVSRQRVHQLRDIAAFPAPLADLRGGAVWDAAAVRKFDQEWRRKPGRPAAMRADAARPQRPTIVKSAPRKAIPARKRAPRKAAAAANASKVAAKRTFRTR